MFEKEWLGCTKLHYKFYLEAPVPNQGPNLLGEKIEITSISLLPADRNEARECVRDREREEEGEREEGRGREK